MGSTIGTRRVKIILKTIEQLCVLHNSQVKCILFMRCDNMLLWNYIILDNDKLKIYCKTYFCVFNASQDCHCQLFDLLLKDEQRSKFGILIIIFPSYILQCCRDNCVIFLMLLSFACRHFQSNLNKKIVYLGFVFISFMFDLWVVCLCLQELCLSLNQVKESPQLTTLGDFQKP